jgi:membrane protein YqaA with SNARE-associated domain
MDPSSFIPDLSSLGGWAYFFVVVMLFSATPFPLFATEVVIGIAGAMANPVLVGLVAGVAASIGELTTYFIGLGGERAIKKRRGKRYEQAVALFEKYGFGAVIIFAFTPLPMDLLGLIAGGLHYNLKKFFLGTLIGKIPRDIIIAYAGAIGAQLIF